MPADVLKLLTAASRPDPRPAPDADLLARFVSLRDEAAFAELVRRHGPAVYRTCKHLLGSSSADDAFQATFLVLACRAKSVRKVGSVGSWLIGVAGRVSRQMRKNHRRAAGVSRLRDENTGGNGEQDGVHTPRSPELAELATILNEELSRLPDSLRTPVVLCLVEGQTQEQAAATLGGSVRTLRRRLDRAKALLRLRLERRGVVPTVAAGLVASLGSGTAALPPGLAGRTVNSVFVFLTGGRADTPAAFVAKGVVGSMARIKVSALMAATAAAMIGLGVGWAEDSRPPAPRPPTPSTPPAKTLSEPAKAEQRTAIKFTGPAGMKIAWEQPDKPNRTVVLVAPKEYSFLPGQTYRLGLSQVPDLPGKTFYPTLEVAPVTDKTRAFLGHSSVQLRFTDEDFSQAEAGNLVVKVLYLPDPALNDRAVLGADEIVSPRLEPGADPIAEAKKRGTILAVVRLGNIDLNVPNALPDPGPGLTDYPPASSGQSANFSVTAPTAVMARVIANEAEYQRKALADRWLGGKLPDWPRCSIRVTCENRKSGATAIQFHPAVKLGHPAYVSAEMELHGPFEYVLTTGLPHEVAHTVLASYFGRPVPRWADEGIALTAEPPEEQTRSDARCRELVQDGKAIRLRTLFPMTEYPKDLAGFHAQGHSVCRFLVGRMPRMIVDGEGKVMGEGKVRKCPTELLLDFNDFTGSSGLTAFVQLGMDGNTTDSWEKAAKEVYEFASVDDLEAAWLDWLKKPESKVIGPPAPEPAVPDLNPGVSHRLPPTPLPGVAARPFLPAPAIIDRIPPTKLPGGEGKR